MPSMTIKNIPDDLYQHLKIAASANHRSLNSELIVCLEKALLPSKPSPAILLEQARKIRKRIASKKFNIEDIQTGKIQGRP